MQIHIRLYGPLRDHLPDDAKGRATLDLPDSATVQNIYQQLDLPATLLFAINDEHTTSLTAPLSDGDEVAFFSAVAGGTYCRLCRYVSAINPTKK